MLSPKSKSVPSRPAAASKLTPPSHGLNKALARVAISSPASPKPVSAVRVPSSPDHKRASAPPTVSLSPSSRMASPPAPSESPKSSGLKVVTTPTKAGKSPYAEPSSPIASASPRHASMPRKPREGKEFSSPAVKGSLRLDVDEEEETAAAGVPATPTSLLFSPLYHPRADGKLPVPAIVQRFQQQQQQQQQARADGDDTYEEEFDPFAFIRNLPPLPAEYRNRKSCIPRKALQGPRVSLALDLDETLVHCSVQPMDRAELTFNVNFNGQDYEVYVRTRPHLQEFLQQVSEWFEIIIFTASQRVYAEKLLDILDPKHQYIKYRVFRDSCVCIDGNYLKDLGILGRELHQVAIVDNSVQAFGFQLDNGIPIESWFDDDEDKELLHLLPFLRQLKEAPDVRPLIRSTFRLHEFVHAA